MLFRNARRSDSSRVALQVNNVDGGVIVADFRPTYDATVVQLLRSAGARIIGKTNCDEFGMGCATP